jgi:hypothetical protein
VYEVCIECTKEMMDRINKSLERNAFDGGYYLDRCFYVTVRFTRIIVDYGGMICICSLSD